MRKELNINLLLKVVQDCLGLEFNVCKSQKIHKNALFQLFICWNIFGLMHLCSLKTELSRTIFSSSSMSSLGRSAVMKAFTVTDTSSGS